jgi:hypothetical protein
VKIEQVRVSFFFPQVFLWEPEPAQIFTSKKKAGTKSIINKEYLRCGEIREA